MAEQHQERPNEPLESRRDADPADDGAAPAAPGSAGGSEQLKGELDNLLDEIDEVLEDNAEQFMANYVQKGGE